MNKGRLIQQSADEAAFCVDFLTLGRFFGGRKDLLFIISLFKRQDLNNIFSLSLRRTENDACLV